MTEIRSLIDFIRQSGAQCRLFDMGRRVSKIPADLFEKVEQAQTPYPHPYMHHAYLAIMLWNPKEKAQSVVWFLKLPLDEQGYLVQAARDDFINRLLINISQMMDENSEDEPQDAMKDNPFAFTPDQEKMAVFHAHATVATSQPASGFFEHAQHYFAGQLGFDQWQELGYQGVADLVVRAEQGNNNSLIAKAIPQLPETPLMVLASCLENGVPHHTVAQALAARLEQELGAEQVNAGVVAALVRGLSNIHDLQLKNRLVMQVLAHPVSLEPEVIVAVGSRCLDSLMDPAVLQPFLEQLAAGKAGQVGFSRMLSDLMFLPVLRALVLRAFRHPERSETLSQAIGEMFGQHFDH